MLNVRLSLSEEKALNDYCQRAGLPRSQVVKEALAIYLAQVRNDITPYEVGKDLFGQEGSGIEDKSTTFKKRLRKLLDEKYPH